MVISDNVYEEDYPGEGNLTNFCTIMYDYDCFLDDMDEADEFTESNAKYEAVCKLYAFVLPKERVELAFSNLHPIFTHSQWHSSITTRIWL